MIHLSSTRSVLPPLPQPLSPKQVWGRGEPEQRGG